MTAAPTTAPGSDAHRFLSPVDLATAWALDRDRATLPGARHDPWCPDRHGWMLELGLDTVLEPVLGRTPTPEFCRFAALGGTVAATLLDRLDPGYLADERQNDSPTIGEFLRAAVAHPDRVRAHGYVVGPARCDERITVEGVLVRTDHELVMDPECGPGCQCVHLVRYVEDELGIGLPSPPHEVGPWRGSGVADGPERGRHWYRLWWD